MNTLALLAAGFSKNWGGWLASEVVDFLLTCPEVKNDAELKSILWANEEAGFEAALEQIQQDFLLDPSVKNRDRLNAMQTAILRTFDAMNSAFYQKLNFESHNNRQGTIRQFLTRFDAIFTLNQDLLLEHHYKDQFDIALESRRRWDAIQIPGMRCFPSKQPMLSGSWARAQWKPLPDNEYVIAPRCQPYFKLHGSCNWISESGEPLLIMGGGKEDAIAGHPILRRYASEFRTRLCCPETRLMVIGYGFKDHHINRTIVEAVNQHGLQMFVVSPSGRDIAKVFRSSVHSGLALAAFGYDLEDIFHRSVIGISRRLVTETFGHDTAELEKFESFFEE